MIDEQYYYDLMVIYQTSDREKDDFTEFLFRFLGKMSMGASVETKKAIATILSEQMNR